MKLATGEGDTDDARFGPCDPCSEGKKIYMERWNELATLALSSHFSMTLSDENVHLTLLIYYKGYTNFSSNLAVCNLSLKLSPNPRLTKNFGLLNDY